MQTLKIGAALALLIAVTAVSPVAAEDDDAWKFGWSNGFKLDSPDGKFQLKFGGRIQADWTFVADQDDANELFYGPIEDANEFRRARLFFEGTIYERIKFKAQYDFADGDPEFKDVYIELTGTPVGNVRVGHFKEPFSLEELTSSKYITFLERSLNNLFSPSRNTGLMFHDTARDDRISWAAGAFRESDDFGETDDASRGKLNLTARVTGLPWYEDGGRRLVHAGLSVTNKDLGTDSFGFDSRPEVHQAVDFIDTGSFAADEVMMYDLELAVVLNRFWAAAEYTVAEADGVTFTTDDPSLDASYVQAGWFLTDDYRRYKKSAGAFDRMKPSKNFGDGDIGAWEVAARYSMADLSEAILNDPLAGELEDLTLALNWYPNPATRVMLNYVMSEPDIPGATAGNADFVTLRVQVDF